MMRLQILVCAVVSMAAMATAAQAQVASTQQNQMTFNGDVAAGCITAAAAASSAQNAEAQDMVSGSANVVVTRLVGDDGVPLGAEISLALPSTCNQAHTLTLTSVNGGMTNAGGALASGAFRSLLPYTVVVNWAGQSQTFSTGAGALTQPVSDAATGPVSVTIQIPSGGAPMVAGSYSDQLVLQLGIAG